MTRGARPALIASAGWLVVYLIIWATGQHFNTRYLNQGWQLVPFDTLRADPLRSVWYLHIQPPVFNLIIGVVGRWSLLPTALTLQLLWMLMGAALAGLLASSMGRVGIRAVPAIVLALFATVNPTVLRLSFEPQYELLTALGLVAILWSVAGLMGAGRRQAMWLIPLLGTLVVMTRTLYHPLWLVGLLVLMLLFVKPFVSPKRVLAVFAIPALLIGGWMLKNDIVFGKPTLSTWTGMNLLRSISPAVSEDDLAAFAHDGHISNIPIVGPFQTYSAYATDAPACVPVHAAPAVSEPDRAEAITSIFGGPPVVVPNFNYECYIPIYDTSMSDAKYLILHRPRQWLAARAWSTREWFGTGIDHGSSKSAVMDGLDWLYAGLRVDVDTPHVSTSGWSSAEAFKPIERSATSLLILVCSLAVVIRALVEAWRVVRGKAPLTAFGAVLIAAAYILSWSFVAGVVGELGEQARFRAMTDPFVVSYGLAVLLAIWPRGRAWLFAPSTGDGEPEEVGQEVVAGSGEDALGMELDTLDR